MLRLLIVHFWPVLLPLLLYVLWLMQARRKAAKAGEAHPAFFAGPWLWAVTASLAMAIGGFIVLGLSAKGDVEGHYVPAQMVDGKIVPAHNEPEP